MFAVFGIMRVQPETPLLIREAESPIANTWLFFQASL